jgi:signal transduction histidine kinase
MTVQQRTSLIFTGITAAILISVSAVAYVFMNAFAFQDFYKRLEIRGVITAKAQSERLGGSLSESYSALREKHLEPLLDERDFVFPADSLQVFMMSAAGAELPASFYAAVRTGRPANIKVKNVFYTGLLYHGNGKDLVAIVGAQNADSMRYAKNLSWILAICSLIGTAVAYTSGIFFSRHTFRPVREIIDKVNMIGVDNLHLRLETRTGQDEISEITSTFNEMLSRLETAFETQNNFVSNASHELRTPLTGIYGEAEIALSREREKEEYKRTLHTIVAHAEKLQHLTDSLLSLAQTGFDGKRRNFELIRLDELITEVKGTLNKIIPENRIQVSFLYSPGNEEDLIVNGNYQLLKLGLSNVMGNACKYSDNAIVSVTLTRERNMLCVIIQDTGIGIPEQELKNIYDPFFRASNTGKYEGYGIGLPLTRNIFRLHKGAIDVRSAPGKGTSVVLSLPAITMA